MATLPRLPNVADVPIVSPRLRFGAVLRSRAWSDVLIAAAVFGLVVLIQVMKPAQVHGREVHQHLTVLGCVVLGMGCTALVFRRRWPRIVLAVTVAAALWYFAVGPSHGPTMFVVLVAMYTVTLTVDRRTALVLGGVATVVLATGNVVLAGGTGVDPNSLLNIVAIGLAYALGDAVRNRRAYLAEVVQRARRAEESREQEARRRVAEERLRIARDLHDVVAHHIAVINVQAGVGGHLLDSDPEQARSALAHIRRASRSALDELSATVGLLRQPDDPRAPTDPTVGLARLDELISGLAGCGLRVDREVTGPVAGLPTALDVTAYRIVQEALTNVQKHANTDSARLRLGVAEDMVRIVIDDDGSAVDQAMTDQAAGHGTTGFGHGMLGMLERAAAVGGRLHAGPRAEGGFRVEALLPIPSRT
jgi:signal transduction histidine kinase